MASTSRSASTEDLCSQWTALNDDELTVDDVNKYLAPIPDDLWVVAACVDRILEDALVERSLLDLAVARTEPALERCRKTWEKPLLDEEDDAPADHDSEEARRHGSLVSHFRDEPIDAQLCRMRAVLLHRLDRLNTFVEICKEAPAAVDESEDEEWADDPWGDGTTRPPTTRPGRPPLPLSEFLVDDLLDIACIFASQENYSATRILLDRHGVYLWPYRFLLLDAIPESALAAEYREILPAYDVHTEAELKPEQHLWRTAPDWSQSSHVRSALVESHVDLNNIDISPASAVDVVSHPEPLSQQELTAWYQGRIDTVISNTGMLDSALSLVQHAASQGIPGLDELGEELSLLSRLVYDAPAGEDELDDDWSLSRWRSMDALSVVNAYLAHSTPSTVARDINRLVMPYLFVLESRAERAGHADLTLPARLLYDYILSAPLEIVAAIFEASKPTLPPAQRVLKDDEDMARLALACLYGSESLNEWSTMSSIFECLPAWDSAQDDEDGEEADTTISSLGAFVAPSTSRPLCTPADLLLFFRPLPSPSLSRALDVLDVHLESGEILSRWSVPAPLRWFLQSNSNISEQRAWANRMVRRAGGSNDRLETQDDWEWLLEDMLKLSGSGESDQRSAFCLLTQDDIIRIFISGLLSSGKFSIAKNLLHSPRLEASLNPQIVEDICLACSQEFYDNASSGNYHFGDMKLAYECLDVPPSSGRIVKEKEFIEATSRLCSFNLMSRPGIPISPIEIRLTKDRLSLVSRVLSSNNDAYKHTQVILDLVYKLGFRGDAAAEVRTLAMLADTALQAEDFDCACANSQRMVDTVLQLRSSSKLGPDDPAVQEACEVCWVACFQLGRQPEFPDTQKKLVLLGHALALCSADRLLDVLAAWRRLEQEDLDERRERLAARRGGAPRARPPKRRAQAVDTASSLTARLHRLHVSDFMPPSPLANAPDAAAFANKAFSRVAANFPFSVGARGRSLVSEVKSRSTSETSRTRLDGGEVTVQASRVLQKGLGWLLGEDDP